MNELNHTGNHAGEEKTGFKLISPRQLYTRINRDLDEPVGLSTIYMLVKQKGFPSVKVGGRYYVLEDKVSEWLQSLTGNAK